ncbi:NAD(+) diphosphatase [Geomesophilobacter sediminis]|uniref:NAD(+) diphosphatase n=1 Tax=Geomesophilobacter sediminis TaxID=2798584 RepID=A0A8J7J577_9BACT|nr:NAD(+) diphosphatase [Geomesophilobacter sediminis]MBJ6723521.1 NAD(+) diphosphatase [Geomesophilobacter sediminis]
MKYPDTINLPFNAEALRERFTQKKPGEMADDGDHAAWVILQGDTILLDDGALPQGALLPGMIPSQGPMLFGLWDGAPIRVVSLSRSDVPPPSLQAVPTVELPDDLMSLAGLAKQLLYWDRLCNVCSRCGGSLERIDLSWGKRCTSCSHEHYPHIHPCVIVLVKRGDEMLLARKPEWPKGRYSLVAGFVDFGESLEECVVREVAEETGIKVHNIRYVGSQNWPFPSQLMAGFVADYLEGEVRVDQTELEDARWFPKGVMPDMLPPRRSIARWIIETYGNDGEDQR